MTPQLTSWLKRLEDLDRAATPKPWVEKYDGAAISEVRGPGNSLIREAGFPENSKFIAESRNALHKLLEIIRIQQEALYKIERSYPLHGERMAHQNYCVEILTAVEKLVNEK